KAHRREARQRRIEAQLVGEARVGKAPELVRQRAQLVVAHPFQPCKQLVHRSARPPSAPTTGTRNGGAPSAAMRRSDKKQLAHTASLAGASSGRGASPEGAHASSRCFTSARKFAARCPSLTR